MGRDARTCDSTWNLAAALKELRGRRLLSSSCLPYVPSYASDTAAYVCTPKCQAANPHVTQGNFNYEVVRDEWNAQRHIWESGAVVTSFIVMSDFQTFFKKPGNAKAVYAPGPGAKFSEWHAVTIVGYHGAGTDDGYWLCLNSWGKTFADGGLFRVKFGCCGILAEAYVVKWTPKSTSSSTPMLQLKPVQNKKGCHWYQTRQGDFLSRIAARAGIKIQQLLLENADRLDRLDALPTGKQLLICNATTPAAAGGRPTAGTIAQPNQQAAASPKPSPAPVFLEGVADMRAISDMYDRAFYRLLATPTATWMYVEKLLSQEHALRFCAIAGGKLASFSSAAETAQVEQLLNATLAPRAESNYDARSANVVIWIDLKRAAGEGNEARWSWQSLVRGGSIGAASYSNWATNEPIIKKGRDCGVLGWKWPEVGQLGVTAWFSYECGYANYGIPALCKLPPSAQLSLPPGMFEEPPVPPRFRPVSLTHIKGVTFYQSLISLRLVTIFRQPLSADTWDRAAQKCKRAGARLFFADKVAELHELRQAIALTVAELREPLNAVWVGAQRAAGSSKWLWDTPAGVQELHSLLLWNPGEPNGQAQERMCLQVTDVLSSVHNNVWMNDQGCGEKLPYVCIL
ncbi:hypothetical protein OEZ85_005929 [Tetradesmus obliquus]|uniref:LysM domain-containing protein n=1 Tax=Tetradesmus obliquus TaxID=3088 RepID=A0ABY8UEZ3_TETOB|nr:hypothetical protein OEZ85_005929 [Tetradesmus obliquus]